MLKVKVTRSIKLKHEVCRNGGYNWRKNQNFMDIGYMQLGW